MLGSWVIGHMCVYIGSTGDQEGLAQCYHRPYMTEYNMHFLSFRVSAAAHLAFPLVPHCVFTCSWWEEQRWLAR